ncbi:MAG: hypothetical protein FD164_468 [Nitrospirae bacterium]|nr:MAG: hypothetical protein FD164_468 [Nitrospirota bacterium]
MPANYFLCVDCFEHLHKAAVGTITAFFCCNEKCRRFGVLTLGGLEDSECKKRIIIEDQSGPAGPGHFCKER